jgi:membrane associated rhomboid family serine protease
MNIASEIRESFKKGDMLTRLIYINVAVFVLFSIISLLGFLFQTKIELIRWFMVPAAVGELAKQPWSLFTYMFLHSGFFHLLINMVWLYFGGQIFMQYLSGRKLLSTYILGGLTGAFLYILAYNAFPVFSEQLAISKALGASASVLAIVIAVATLVPNYTVRLFLLGPVKLKYIGIFSVIMDILSIPNGNAGGHIAHLGGAAFGFIYASQMKEGRNISAWFESVLDKIFIWIKPKPKLKVEYKRPARDDIDYNADKAANQARIDAILDKISQSGYSSLSTDEKNFLFKMGKQ